MLNVPLVQIILPWNEKMEDKKLLKKAKNINTNLKTDSNSVLFFKEKWGKRLLTKLKKSKDMKHSLLLELLTTSVRGGKAFVAEQKIREIKRRISKLKAQKLKNSSKNNFKFSS